MTQLQDRQWIQDALSFWSGTTPEVCGCSQVIIDWNVRELTKALEKWPHGDFWIKGPAGTIQELSK